MRPNAGVCALTPLSIFQSTDTFRSQDFASLLLYWHTISQYEHLRSQPSKWHIKLWLSWARILIFSSCLLAPWWQSGTVQRPIGTLSVWPAMTTSNTMTGCENSILPVWESDYDRYIEVDTIPTSQLKVIISQRRYNGWSDLTPEMAIQRTKSQENQMYTVDQAKFKFWQLHRVPLLKSTKLPCP